MPRYLITRTIPPLSPEELDLVGKRVVEACEKLGMRWIRSHVTTDGKHTFCEFEAPSEQACREHAALAALPVDDVLPLGMEIGPAQFK
jgi:hypothetical protein